MAVFEKIGIELVCKNFYEKVCFACAVVSSFVLNAASVNDRYIAVNCGGSNNIVNNSELVAANLQNFEVIKKFDLVKALNRDARVDDRLSLEFRVEDLFCGQWELRGIYSDNAVDENTVECGAVISIIDDVTKEDYQQEIQFTLKKIFDINNDKELNVCKPYVMFAVSCSEFDMKEAQEFIDENFGILLKVFRDKNIKYGVMPYSIALGGGSEPVPCNVDKIICDVVYNSSLNIRKILEKKKSRAEKSINDNIGVFNRRNIRWANSMHKARSELSDIIRACYAADNAVRYFADNQQET